MAKSHGATVLVAKSRGEAVPEVCFLIPRAPRERFLSTEGHFAKEAVTQSKKQVRNLCLERP